MHPFHNYLATLIEKKIQNSTVVVFYDPKTEFKSFIAELEETATPSQNHSLREVTVNETVALFLRFNGSFFQIKADAEPNMSETQPQPMLIYIPGADRDPQGSVLMELEKAGIAYIPQSLKRLARNVLRKHYTDGDIDDMLAPNHLTYEDIGRFLSQEGNAQTSLVKLVLGEGNSEDLITRWLGETAYDSELEAKQATSELYKLVQSRLDFAIEEATPLVKARRQVTRYLLVNEFRADLQGDHPEALDFIPQLPETEQRDRLRAITQGFRRHYPDPYIELADDLERELQLTDLGIDASILGNIDTFRFEEKELLRYAAELCCQRDYDSALRIISERSRSFWIDRDLRRRAQWEVCRLVAELGEAVTRVRPLLKSMGTEAEKWVQAYVAPNGWFQADRAQRNLESWLAQMDDDPEDCLEQAIGLVRRAHENLLENMAQGFTGAIVANQWTVPNILHQTRIYPDWVEPASGSTAYFLVDAMRYEMGADLAEQLQEVEELTLLPAIAALPSVTPVGMAALLPNASASFSVVEHKGSLASQIEDSIMPSLAERKKFLKARIPDAKDIDLGELLQKPISALKRKIAQTQLLVVRSQSIDALGEMDGGLLGRQIMDTVIGNLARAIRKLRKMGFENFIITADHGHQFSLRKQEDMMIDKPGGTAIDQHRRCWVGHGGQTPGACIRVSGQELGYDTDLDFIFPKGIAVFKAGGDLAFHHGGISLQEMVIPMLKLRLPSTQSTLTSEDEIALFNYPTTLNTRTLSLTIFRQSTLLSQDPIPVQVIIVAEGQEVGRLGMALNVEFDRTTSSILLPAGREISIGMMLSDDQRQSIRVVAQDPQTDKVLAQTPDIPVVLSV